MSLEDVFAETNRFLEAEDDLDPDTGTGGSNEVEPLPRLAPGVPFYDVTVAWIEETWGVYDKMPRLGRNAWYRLLRVSKGGPGSKKKILKRWARWLESEWGRTSSHEWGPVDLTVHRETDSAALLDENGFVPMSDIWCEHFESAGTCSRFLDKHETDIRQCKPSPRRRLVYLPDWHHFWKKREKMQSDALDDERLQEQIGDIEARKSEARDKRRRG